MTETSLRRVVETVHVACAHAFDVGPAIGSWCAAVRTERKGARSTRISTRRRAVALGDGAPLGAAGRLHDRLAGRSRGGWPRPRSRCASRRRERDARRARAPRTGTGSGVRAEARESYDGGWEMVLGRYVDSAGGGGARPDSPYTPTSIGSAGGPSRSSVADELGRRRGAKSLRRLVELVRRPPAQLEHVLGVQLLPREAGLRLERRRADEVVLLALAVPLAADERDDVEPRPDDGPISTARQPRLLRELAPDRVLGGLARLDPAARRRPERPARGTRSGRAGSGRPGRARPPGRPGGSGARSRRCVRDELCEAR